MVETERGRTTGGQGAAVGEVALFAGLLRDFHRGGPSTRRIAEVCLANGWQGSHATFDRMLAGKGKRLPKEDVLKGFLRGSGACDDEVLVWLGRLHRARDRSSSRAGRRAGRPAPGAELVLRPRHLPARREVVSGEVVPVGTREVVIVGRRAHRSGPRRGIGAAVAALLAVLSVGLGSSGGPTLGGRPLAFSGTATCDSGARVVQVWIQSDSGVDSGFVTPAETPAGARFSYVLPAGDTYSVHVGCGGTRADWANDDRSSDFADTDGTYVCHDSAALAEGQHVGSCDRA